MDSHRNTPTHLRSLLSITVIPDSPPKLSLSPGDLQPQLLDQPHSPSQTANRSNQPFCHSTPSGQTNRQMVFAKSLYQHHLCSTVCGVWTKSG